jgi:hypothetical protein
VISVIVYGRNDNHGYQYNKRCSISLNALAQMLTDPLDEICFVDYNTPNDLATLPETINENLNQNTKNKLRVFRVRPKVHAQYTGKTHLKVIESIARNIALRRSNPQNRWILSTNTDILITPLTANKSLSSIADQLKDGFYQLPRYELPEYLWEALFQSSRDAQQNIDLLSKQSNALHLNIATQFSNFMRYDNMGDFQLMLREDLFKIDGFDERMLLGWTVDANICKRLFLLRGKVDSLEDELACYHCNHSRIPSILVKNKKSMDTADTFVDAVKSPYLENQRDTWGQADIEIEAISLNKTLNYNRYTQALLNTLSQEFNKKHSIIIDNKNESQYHHQYIFPYLADHLATLAPNTNVSYIGNDPEFMTLIQNFWKHMNYTGQIHMPCVNKNSNMIGSKVVIVDLLNSDYKKNAATFQQYLKQLDNPKNTKIIGINIDKCNKLLKFKKIVNVTSRSTVSNMICGYLL